MTTRSTTNGSDVTIRTATPTDGAAIGDLFANSPDEGAVSFAPRFSHDPYRAYAGLRPESTGFVAETTADHIVGVGFVSLTEARFGGELRPTALLNALAVHPDYRGRGLAKRLVERRLEHARGRLGEDCVAFANIQHGNDPSRAVASSWADSLAREYVMYPAEPLDSPPDSLEYGVHDAGPDERSAAVDRSNEFYADTDLYRPYSPAELGDRLAESPIDEPLHRYLVATINGEVVAGVFASEIHKLMRLVLESLPPALENAESLPSAIPESEELRMTMLSDLWYARGHEPAARALWQLVRADSEGANRIMLNYDPAGRLADALALTPDDGAMELSVAVKGADIQSDEIAPVF